MNSAGEKLNKARLAKNLTFDEVYQATKIHPRVLEALEQDRAQNFLGLTYIKGFLRSYAQYLGLDSEKILQVFLKEHLQASQQAFLQEGLQGQAKETAAVKLAAEKKTPWTARVNLFPALRTGAIIALSIFLIFYFRFMLKNISATSGGEKRTKVRVEVLPAPAVQTEDLVLTVATKDTCWMRVAADNRVVFEKTLSKGRKEHWRAKERIELRIGKPEAIEVFLNGAKVDLKKAKVKRRLIITQEGIEGR